MKTLLTTTSLAAFLAAAPALAQTDTQPAIDQPALTEPAPPAPDAMAPNVPAAVDQTAPSMDAVPDTAATPPVEPAPSVATTEPQIFIGEQAAEEKLASNWIGQSLYNPADENVGDINDLLVNEDGSVAAVIVGVGGFLGIGEKDVAVSFNAIEPRTDPEGNLTLYIKASKEQLEAAPEFLTLAELRDRTAPQASTQ